MNTMTSRFFTPLTIDTAPEASKPILKEIRKSSGFIPNLMAIFARNPTVLQGCVALDAAYEKGSLTARDRQIILLATSVENNCNFCADAHSTIATAFLFTPSEIVAAIVDGTQIHDSKINSLVTLVKEIVRERGHVSNETIQGFLDAGYKEDQVMELLLGVALETISNYVDHISLVSIDKTPRD